MKKLLTLALILGLATPALALPPLSENAYINDRLIQARVADRIRKECGDIAARFAYAYSQARALKQYALDQGYTDAQIEAFLDSKPDKDRVKAAAEAYLRANGATDEAGFCALGRKEIAAGTVAGSLIYEN
ncbi:MAG: DUF5333 domain-containing protein [Paracoccaceae bacterium]